MCGIVGLMSAGYFTKVAGKAIKDLITIDVVRGKDSTGVAAINAYNEEESIIYKRAMPANDFLCLQVPEKIFKNIEDFNVIIGHNRSATSGDWFDSSSHPIVEENIVMVHNGTVYDYGDLDIPKDIVKEQDTKVIAHLLTKYPPEKIMQEIDGGTCLVWWDYKTKELCFVRNADRPMSLRILDNGAGLAFASEKWMLDSLIRHNFNMGKIISLPVNTVVKYSVKDNKIVFEEKEFKVPVRYTMSKWDSKERYSQRLVEGTGIRLEQDSKYKTVALYSDTKDNKKIEMRGLPTELLTLIPKAARKECEISGYSYASPKTDVYYVMRDSVAIIFASKGIDYYLSFKNNKPVLEEYVSEEKNKDTIEYVDCDFCCKPFPVDDLVCANGGVVCEECLKELAL